MAAAFAEPAEGSGRRPHPVRRRETDSNAHTNPG
jgi:hypothetical protein